MMMMPVDEVPVAMQTPHTLDSAYRSDPKGAPMSKHPWPCVLMLTSFAMLASACGSSDDGPDGSDEVIGTFLVRLVPDPGYTDLMGTVFDRPSPQDTIWELAAREGDCQLLTPRVPFCEEDCGGDALCVEDDTCQAYPTAQDVGTIQAHGLRTADGTTEFSMDPIGTNKNYMPSGFELAYPAFAEGDQVSLDAEGSSFAPAFSLQATGIAALVLSDQELVLTSGQALALAWTPPGQVGPGRISVKLDISHHGGTKGKILCDASDDGSLEVPATLVTQLLALGYAGFPTIVVTRSSVGSADIPAGPVELALMASVEEAVTIPGLVSCNEDGDCPAGQTCKDDLSCGP
jgi:hypothetical protein